MKTVDQLSADGLIKVALLAPLDGGVGTVAAISNGPRLIALMCDPACREIAQFQNALQRGVEAEKARTLLSSSRARDLAQDAQALALKTQPVALLWEMRERNNIPYALWPDGMSLPVSVTTAIALHILHRVPMIADGDDFTACSVPTPEDRPWSPRDLHVYYSRMAAQHIQGLEFDTEVPAPVAAFLQLLEEKPEPEGAP